MAGILRVDQANVDIIGAKTAGGSVYIPGHIIQVQSTLVNTSLSGTVGGSSNPAYNSGYSYATMQFTPKSVSSKLWLSSSALSIGETTNNNDDFWLAAFYDTTRICCNGGSAYSYGFGNYYNQSWYSFNNIFNSWGTTTKTLDFRVGAGNVTGSAVIVNYTAQMDASARNVSFVVAEIAQ